MLEYLIPAVAALVGVVCLAVIVDCIRGKL